jgi:hypothetical protein
VPGAASSTIQIDNDDPPTFAAPILEQTVTASEVTVSTLPPERIWWRLRVSSP